ncbi:MAG: SDR family oxidoreductase [Bacteroidia bacterium]|nr:SDR family oxidoreductase [Bacteroidia bacterium]
MKKEFQDKVVLITGSSMGIGKAMASHFAMRGAKVAINARNAEKLGRTAKELRQEGFEILEVPADVSVWEQVEGMITSVVTHFGQLDILINNAGIATRGSVENVSPEVFQKMVNVNILGSVFPSKAAMPYISKQSGSIIFVSSIAAFYGLPYNGIYSSTKKALTAFSESLRLETKEKGIHVGIAYVSFTENDPQKIILDSDGNRIYLENRKGIKKQSPETVSSIISNMVLMRRNSVSLSFMGKALNFIHRIFPGIIKMIYTRNMATIKAQSEGKPRYVEAEKNK